MTEKHAYPAIDPDKNQIIAILGRKGSGKSANAFETFRAWPNIDRLIIDPTGDADPALEDAVTVHKLPERLPEPKQKGEPVTLRWIADPASATYREDLDRALGAALFPKNRRVLVWVDEAEEVFPANRTGPLARLLLAQSRHWYVSLIAATPRPMGIDPKLLSQADRVIIYDMPHPRDRERVAESIGWAPKAFAAAMDETARRGDYWSMVYDRSSHGLYRVPPLPLSAGYKHAQQ